MAKNEKRVSTALFDKIAKEHFQNESVVKWHEAEVHVKRVLSLTDMLGFVDDVVRSCFHDRMGFMPEVMDFAIKDSILTRYANFTMPDNLERCYQMVYATDAVDTVCAAIDTRQLQEIVNAIESKIRFMCDSKSAEIEARVNDALAALEEVRDRTQDIFAGINREDIKNIMGAITDEGLSEQKIVKAYLDMKNDSNAAADTATHEG